MSLTYTKEKLGDKFYKVITTVNDVEHTFHCVIANDTDTDLDEIVQWNINQIGVTYTAPEPTYADKRKMEYPPIENYIDGIVKNDTEQIQSYIDACKAVKAKYPKS
jgi:hypothetical protein